MKFSIGFNLHICRLLINLQWWHWSKATPFGIDFLITMLVLAPLSGIKSQCFPLLKNIVPNVSLSKLHLTSNRAENTINQGRTHLAKSFTLQSLANDTLFITNVFNVNQRGRIYRVNVDKDVLLLCREKNVGAVDPSQEVPKDTQQKLMWVFS